MYVITSRFVDSHLLSVGFTQCRVEFKHGYQWTFRQGGGTPITLRGQEHCKPRLLAPFYNRYSTYFEPHLAPRKATPLPSHQPLEPERMQVIIGRFHHS